MMLNRNLELFIRVAEYGSITKVAKAFYITQPAVSNAIAKLEDGWAWSSSSATGETGSC